MIHDNLDDLLETLPLKDGMSVSFHHHYRNGDHTLNNVLSALRGKNIKDMHLYASGIFPAHKSIEACLRDGNIKDITTNYLNGPVADYLKKNGIRGRLKMQSHGGRARAIIEGENKIDVAFIAASAADKNGNASGLEGKNPCGSLGYAVEDAQHATIKVLITDTILDDIENPQIKGAWIDHILVVADIGDASGIVSGTLNITKDPLGLRIARDTMRLLEQSGIIKDGVSYQSGAGGISLAITDQFNHYLREEGIKASFFTGGITQYHVRALKENLVETLYDVQCFDLEAIKSLRNNPGHQAISASDYANPNNEKRAIRNLDIVILGASEIDLDFNVNVTTDSYHTIIGGSGGHSDTAEDAFLTVIVSPLLKARTSLIKKRVTTITTPGQSVDCLVTERGIAINPRRKDLLERFETSALPIMTIEKLKTIAERFTGRPAESKNRLHEIGLVEDRHGERLDNLYMKE